ncbi:MAG: carboxylating nicotinate-nucleotide diphosphorylase [Phycisphaerales bacterium]
MHDLAALSLDALFNHLTADGSLERLLEAARDEDLSAIGDVTSLIMIESSAAGIAVLRTRAEGVIAGLAAMPAVLNAFHAEVIWQPTAQDGDVVAAGQTLGRLEGNMRDLLALERTALNLICRLSGIATLTRRYVKALRGSTTSICDTRKTTPGLRTLEKYAVRCGGGTLHRMGLFDAVLIKDNHLSGIEPDQLTDVLNQSLRDVRTRSEIAFVEVEVDSLDQLERVMACAVGLVDMVLLDNMSIEQLSQAVVRRNAMAPSIQLEASGGITLERVAEIAATGVDRISVGALTHSATALDIGLDIEE